MGEHAKTEDCIRDLKIKNPYNTGDIVYVKETWKAVGTVHKFPTGYIYKASPELCPYKCPYAFNGKWEEKNCLAPKWKPATQMPFEAARIFLLIKNVRVERVQGISNEDAIREGFVGAKCDCAHKECGGGMVCCTDCMNTGWLEPPKVDFMLAWNDKYEKRGLSWDRNPWTFAYEIERIEKPKEF
jgi:hypothetical protein